MGKTSGGSDDRRGLAEVQVQHSECLIIDVEVSPPERCHSGVPLHHSVLEMMCPRLWWASAGRHALGSVSLVLFLVQFYCPGTAIKVVYSVWGQVGTVRSCAMQMSCRLWSHGPWLDRNGDRCCLTPALARAGCSCATLLGTPGGRKAGAARVPRDITGRSGRIPGAGL